MRSPYPRLKRRLSDVHCTRVNLIKESSKKCPALSASLTADYVVSRRWPGATIRAWREAKVARRGIGGKLKLLAACRAPGNDSGSIFALRSPICCIVPPCGSRPARVASEGEWRNDVALCGDRNSLRAGGDDAARGGGRG